MALRRNTGLINGIANAFGALFGSGTLKIYSGGQPATGNDAAAGTLLATINLPASPFGAAAAGVISKSGTWAAVAVADGTAGWARFTSNDTAKSFDCTVAEAGGDLTIDDDAIVTGGNVVVTAFTYTVPLA